MVTKSQISVSFPKYQWQLTGSMCGQSFSCARSSSYPKAIPVSKFLPLNPAILGHTQPLVACTCKQANMPCKAAIKDKHRSKPCAPAWHRKEVLDFLSLWEKGLSKPCSWGTTLYTGQMWRAWKQRATRRISGPRPRPFSKQIA